MVDLHADANPADARAQVRRAAELEAAGRHDEALQLLARAASAHDAEAMALLGRKLFLGSGAPRRAAEGVSLLDEAAGRGSAAAAALLAVVAGGGFYGRQSWTRALGYLGRAAGLGLRGAREQVLILAAGPAGDAALAGGDWPARAAAIDIGAWLSPPPLRSLSSSPRIAVIERLAPPAACDWIISQSRDRLAPAEVTDARTGLPVMGATRTNRQASFGLGDASLLGLVLQARIGHALGLPPDAMEAFAVLNYRPGEEASEHVDYLDPAIPAYAAEIARVGQRVATVLLYLNDDYRGGETAFPELGIGHRGGKGDALAFFSVEPDGRPDPRTLHAGRPPSSGQKWVLSQFVRDRRIVP